MRSLLLRLSVGFALSLLVLAPGSSLAGYYLVSHETTTYQTLPIAGGGPLESLAMTGGLLLEPRQEWLHLPFSVMFYGEPYTRVNVLGMGVVTFGEEYIITPESGRPRLIPEMGFEVGKTVHNFVAVWWQDVMCNFSKASPIHTQVVGKAPNRSFVIQWKNCHKLDSSILNAQLWLQENSDTIVVHYGGLSGDWMTSVGVENFDGSDGTPGLSSDCNPLCGPADVAPGLKITYTGGPHLVVESVQGESVGFPGESMPVQATLKNRGSGEALGFGIRVLLNDEPFYTEDAIEVGAAANTFDLVSGAQLEVTLSASLPRDLQEGQYYVLVEADPLHSVWQPTRRGSIGASGSFSVGPASSILAAVDVHLLEPERIEPGEWFTVGWTAENRGNGEAAPAPFSVVLSPHELVGFASRPLHTASIELLPPFSAQSVETQVLMPADVLPGHYHLGVIFEGAASDGVGIGVSEPVVVASDRLEVMTDSLAPAQVGQPYCGRLEAFGGDWIHLWAPAPGSTLPPGLKLEEQPEGARELGLPFVTSLCGSPSEVGSFAFTLEVNSAGSRATADLMLEVMRSDSPATILTTELPHLPFDSHVELLLRGQGGSPPYVWALARGKLPSGLALLADGSIVGSARESGTFPIAVEMKDAAMIQVEQMLEVVVASPGEPVCTTQRLSALRLEEPFTGALAATGGSGAYRWTSLNTRQLASGSGETGSLLGDVPPPGLSLNAQGLVSGAPSRAGDYLWTIELGSTSRDGQTSVTSICQVLVQVQVDHGLTVTTTRLPVVLANFSYSAKLHASGGSGSLHWKLVEGNGLPAGLELSTTGAIEGTVGLDALEGEPSRTFPLLVEVRDAANRRGLAPLTITLRASEGPRAPSAGEEKRTESSGCSAGAGSLGLWGPSLGVGLILLLRQRGQTGVRRRGRR